MNALEISFYPPTNKLVFIKTNKSIFFTLRSCEEDLLKIKDSYIPLSNGLGHFIEKIMPQNNEHKK